MRETCNMPTGNGFTFCKRAARIFYLRDPGESHPDGLQIAAYCLQHDQGARAALLRPLPWEYDYRFDRTSGTIERARVARKG